MAQWDADIPCDRATVLAVARLHHPDLLADGGTVELLGEGWDNAVWIARSAAGDARLALRFPRRTIALPLNELEARLLPVVAPMLPLAVPVPVLCAQAPGLFPHPYTAHVPIAGRELGGAGLGAEASLRAAEQVAAFVRALHDPSVVAAVKGAGVVLPIDRNARGDLELLTARARTGVDGAAVVIDDALLVDAARAVFDAAALEPGGLHGELRVVHGDLHIRHVLLDGDGSGDVTGIIDWGDACLAPACVDLAIAFSAFDGAARARFLQVYGHVTAGDLLRGRVVALLQCAAIAAAAADGGDHALAQHAVAAFARAVRD